VGTQFPNGLGLYDVSGNVREWVSDWYKDGDYPNNAFPDHAKNENPLGPLTGTGRVFRGGGWDKDANECQSGFRLNDFAKGRYDNLGFRLVRTK